MKSNKVKNFFEWVGNILTPFCLKMTDIYLFEKLGKDAYIRNGVGYGFISDEFLYDNGLLEIGIGRTISGFGDWMGGSYESTCPLKITIDKNYVIRKVETDSFYNSKSSQRTEKSAQSFARRLKIGDTFLVKDKFLRECLEKIFAVIPCKWHIGFDIYRSPHMIKHFTEQNDSLLCFRDSEYLKQKGETE